MTNQHLITPPPELVEQLRHVSGTWIDKITTAYQAGADQELEACCEWLVRNYNYPEAGNPLRTSRRPKPPSLKEQALDALRDLDQRYPSSHQAIIIRKALEEL